ncbi:MAG: signal peptidase II [Boseongicola sp. SB0676_bin_33]|uniref:Lipoprotein signal peptidase n=1 Tax=Boseongicola sp. SB0664_bin_43 TaxID=2604844 RepID=A0A6B0Y2N6_9RHOB|nr:signal peptidase II [Boseongicola sp. SB0664_bin_43]MYF88883.1 signal peptidase II [Boseongicola sp. SB0676_bin_33]
MRDLSPLLRAAALTVLVDQLTKYFVVNAMNLKELGAIPVLPPYIQFRMAWNEGVNFGIPLAGKWVLVALAVAICGAILWWMTRDRPGSLVQVSAGLVIGGAVGNVIDRLIYGAVADFLNMSCCGWRNPWSFNVADIAIFVGAFGLITLGSRTGRR